MSTVILMKEHLEAIKNNGHRLIICRRHPGIQYWRFYYLWVSDIDVLTKDTGLPADELNTCMQERKVWRSISARAGR